MASVSRALGRIKEDLQSHLPERLVLEACRAAGHRWRERKLGPVLTLHLFVLQVLHLNTAIRALRHLVREPAVSAAAYCRARARLPVEVLRSLLRSSAKSIRQAHAETAAAGADAALWRGHRTLLLDGTSTIAPDTPPSRRRFKQRPRRIHRPGTLRGGAILLFCIPEYRRAGSPRLCRPPPWLRVGLLLPFRFSVRKYWPS